MNRSETIDQLAAALAAAQSEMSNPVFDALNPHYRSKYASLAAVRNAVIPVLSRHGIAVTQYLTRTERGVLCGVLLMHSSGQWIEFDPLEIPASKDDAQGYVSAATYAKRTVLQAVACVVGDDDDDANAAVGKPAAPAVEEKPAVALDPSIVARFDSAQTADELKAVWTSIPVGARHAYAKLKDEAKARVAAAAKEKAE